MDGWMRSSEMRMMSDACGRIWLAKVAKVAEGEEGGESWGEAEAEMAKMAKLINAVAEAAKQDQAEVDAGVIERLKADLEVRL